MLQLPQTGRVRSWHDALDDPRAVGDGKAALAAFHRLLAGWNGWADGAPFANRFFTSFQGRPMEGVRLHQLLVALEGVENVELAGCGLASPTWQEFNAAVMALEFCAAARGSGHAVAFLKNTHQRSPDARVVLDNRWATLEFKALHGRDEQAKWDALIQRLVDERIDLGQLEIEFAAAALDFVDAIASCLAAAAATSGRSWTPFPQGGGRFRRATGLASFKPPFSQKASIDRIPQKLKSWCTQLCDRDDPTVLVVDAKGAFDLAMPGRVAGQAEALGQRIRIETESKRMIGGVLVYDEPFLGPLPGTSVSFDGFRMVLGASPRGFARAAMLVPNAAARVPLEETEFAALVGPAMFW